MKLALAFGTGLYILAQSAQPILGEFGALAQLGAVGILGWITIMLVREQKEQRVAHAAALDQICERFDGWEKIRHEDSEANRDTLVKITAQCARAQAERENAHGRKA